MEYKKGKQNDDELKSGIHSSSTFDKIEWENEKGMWECKLRSSDGKHERHDVKHTN